MGRESLKPSRPVDATGFKEETICPNQKEMAAASFKSWIYNHSVKDMKEATHIGMTPTPGKFRIKPDEFFTRLTQANQAGVFPAVLEKRPEVFPLVIDLDFNAPDKGQTTSLYDLEKGLRPFIKETQSYYRKTFPNCPEVLNFYIQLREAPYKAIKEGNPVVKDGIHIVCPELRATSEDHLAARRKGLAEGWLKPMLAKSLHTNAPEDVWDKAVLCDNNWFPIGCSKDVAPPYRLVGFFTSTGEVQMTRHAPKEELMEDYARKCSFLLPSPHPTLTSPIKESLPAEVAEEQEEAEQEEAEPEPASEPASVKTDPPASVSLTKVKNALGKIPAEWFESRKNWVSVIGLVKGISPALDYRNLVLKACRQPKRYDSDAHEKAGMDLWAKTEPRLGADAAFRVLKSISKKEAPAEEEEEVGSQHDDPVYKAMKAKFEELVEGKPRNLKLLNPPCYMTLVGNEWFPRKPHEMDLCYGNMAWDKGYVHRKGWDKQFVYAWMADPTTITYERMDFYPAGEAPPNIFNTFTGLACDKSPVREAEPEEFPELLQLLRHLCEDDASYEYVLSLLAWRLQTLGRPVGVALCLAGGQGTGKDSFIGFIGSLFGECYYRTSRPAHDLFGTFNAQLKDKLLIHIEEASGKDFIAKADDFKSLITSDKISLRLMNTNAYMTKFCGMFILSTNNLNPLKIEADDRRFFIVNVKDHPFKQDAAFFKRFHEMTARPGVIRWFADLLRARDLSSFNLIHSRPATKAMEVGKALSTPPIANFLEAWGFNDPSVSHIRWGETPDEVIIGSSELYKAYQSWCAKDSLTEAYSQKKFVMNLKALDSPAITHTRTKEKSVFQVSINGLRKWLVDKNLCWDENHKNIVNGVGCVISDD